MNIKSLLELPQQVWLMNNKNVLVTGGAGYIGAHACKALYLNGFTPIVFDNLSTGNRGSVKWGPLVVGDLLNFDDINQIFKDYEITSVMHFAAKAYVHESVRDPIKYYRENINGSINLLDSFIRNGGENFVFSSSCATYGESSSQFITEDHRQEPINPYGFTKLAIERLIIDLKNVCNFNFSILRYFNAAGADSELQIGEDHSPETHVIPLILQAAEEKTLFKVYGKDFNTNDGSAIRDYTHVSDLAEAHIASLIEISNSRSDLICNLGTGNGTSVLELISAVKHLYPDFKYSLEDRREGDPPRLVANNDKSRKILGLKYEKSNLLNILVSAQLWKQANALPIN